MKMKNFLFVSLSIVVSSCTTLSKEDCHTINWNERGQSDALKGKTSTVFADYAKTCSKHGIAIDQDGYVRGREKGLKFFCTYDNGQKIGREGETYHGVCPQKWEPEFLKGYRIGQTEYELAKKEADLERRKQKLEEEEANLRSRQAELPGLLMSVKRCTFNSDCTIDRQCSFDKCEGSGAKCTFNSDCAIEGRCSSETFCVGPDCNKSNICKYD